MFKPVEKRDHVFRAIYVGALSLRKGIAYLLEAIAPISAKVESWLVGGRMPETERILARRRDCFRHVGTVPRNRLAEFYSQSSVFILPSVEDGFGMVMAQAMACGLPVIATTNTGAEDLFTDGREGFIVPIRNPEAIREKLIYLYEHPAERDAMSRAALARVRSLGGWNSYGEKIASVYRTRCAKQVQNGAAVTA